MKGRGAGERRKVPSINMLNKEVITPPPQPLPMLRAVAGGGGGGWHCLFPSSGEDTVLGWVPTCLALSPFLEMPLNGC